MRTSPPPGASVDALVVDTRMPRDLHTPVPSRKSVSAFSSSAFVQLAMSVAAAPGSLQSAAWIARASDTALPSGPGTWRTAKVKTPKRRERKEGTKMGLARKEEQSWAAPGWRTRRCR